VKLRKNHQFQFSHVDARRLVFVDESGCNIAMTRAYAWAREGTRAHGHVPKNWGDNVSMMGAIGLDGLRTLATLEGAVDSEAFGGFVGHFLAPVLHPGDIVLWDNLSVHKAAGAREAIEAVGAQLVWLPPYSPDFNPIEECWSKLKALLRSAAARTREELDKAIAKAMAAITAADAAGWFTHAGYQAHSA
jgi:transposase